MAARTNPPPFTIRPRSDEQCKAGPERTYRLGDLRFGRYGWRWWEASRNGRGSGARTPWGAWWRLRRWERQPARPA